jgi:hypothetical protein
MSVVFYLTRLIAGIGFIAGAIILFTYKCGYRTARWAKIQNACFIGATVFCAISVVINAIWHVDAWPVWRGVLDVMLCAAWTGAAWYFSKKADAAIGRF